MESELAGTSSGGILSDLYNFNRPEMIGDPLGPSAFPKFVAFEDDYQNMVFIGNSTNKKENSLSCDDENLTELKNVQHIPEEVDKEEASDVYLSTGIYIHPLSLNGNYENIIELIDVDPDEKLDVGSPLPNNENPIDNASYNMAFGCLLPINDDVVPFFHNYAKIPTNGDLPSLPMVYNISSTANNSPSENLNSNNKKIVPPFLKRNRKPKSANIVEPPELIENNNDDDDVVFVKEWALPGTLEKSQNPKHAGDLKTSNNGNVEATTSSSSSPSTPIKRRRRRRTFGEKRKNPVRKAHIDKASMDLAEKLAIPSSVFNARLKGRKPKQKIVVETKNLRQSCRTTGAILSPPRTLTNCDYKEWPVDGMHERPFYDETSKTIIKYHILNATIDDNVHHAGARPVLSEISNVEEENNRSKSVRSLLRKNATRKPSKKTTSNNTQSSNAFETISLQRLQLLFGYVKDLKEFTKMTAEAKAASQENTVVAKNPAKPTVYEKSLEFRLYQNEIKEKKLKKRPAVNEDIKKAQKMLRDACRLYSLAAGVTQKEVTNLVKSYDKKKGKNWVRPQM